MANPIVRTEETDALTHGALRSVIEHSPFGMAVVDSSLRIVHMDARSRNGIFRNVRPVIGCELLDAMRILFPEPTARELVSHFRCTLETGQPYHSQRSTWTRVDLEDVESYEWEIHRILLPDGDFAVACYFVETTELRQRADALTRIHELSEYFVQLGPSLEECLARMLETAMWVMGAEKGAIHILDETANVLRIGAHKGLPPRFVEFFGEVRAGADSACTAALRTGSRVVVENVLDSPVFADPWTLEVVLAAGIRAVQSTPLKSAAGHVLGTISTHFSQPHRPHDADFVLLELLARQAAEYVERKRSEQSLRAADEQLRQISETMSALVTRCSRDLHYVWVSKPYAEWLELEVDEIVGRPIVDILGRDAFEQLRPHFERVLEGEVVHYEQLLDVKNIGLRWITATYRPTFDRSGRCDGWVAAVVDIDDRKRMEQSIEFARAAAEDANRTKDEFLATVSHELRSPLQGILNWLTLLREGRLDETQRTRALDSVERNVRVQLQLVRDMLDVSRIAAGKVELDRKPVDLGGIVGNASDECLPRAAAQGIDLSVLDGGCGLVLGDTGRLHQVFANLLDNAMKFTPSGGRVTLECRREGDQSVVAVSDTGDGIDPSFLPRLFEHFTQADTSSTRRYGGLGLGLAIVKQLVELHGGTVRARSDGIGRGATFEVRIPELALSSTRGQPAPAPNRSVRRLDGVQVLLVDDDVDSLDAMSMVLRVSGASVRSASSAADAWRAFVEQEPDVLVSDLSMPEEDGYSLLRRIQKTRTRDSFSAVALTGFTRDEDRERALAAGFATHVPKPVDPDTLVNILGGLLPQRVGH
ncbi:MAG TPA: ATP-binding protein [Candidatus Binatia bacterium]|jgi:PAS domain S-box-containing protein